MTNFRCRIEGLSLERYTGRLRALGAASCFLRVSSEAGWLDWLNGLLAGLAVWAVVVAFLRGVSKQRSDSGWVPRAPGL